MNTDANLRRECALGDLAVEGRARKPGARKDGGETDDLFGIEHGTCFLCLTVSDAPWVQNWQFGHVLQGYGHRRAARAGKSVGYCRPLAFAVVLRSREIFFPCCPARGTSVRSAAHPYETQSLMSSS